MEFGHLPAILYKVKFSEPSEDYATKGESIEYKTPSISGRAMANDEGNWKICRSVSNRKRGNGLDQYEVWKRSGHGSR
jgi:hypothetical protein